MQIADMVFKQYNPKWDGWYIQTKLDPPRWVNFFKSKNNPTGVHTQYLLLISTKIWDNPNDRRQSALIDHTSTEDVLLAQCLLYDALEKYK